MENTSSLGEIVKTWRSRRRMSQLDLALEADISSRHLSFIETGRSRPTRSMVLRIADQLDIPLRDRNAMLLAAGHSPEYTDNSAQDGATAEVLATLHGVVDQMLPSPALIIDGGWDLLASNAMAKLLMGRAAAHLLTGRINVIRLCLHPNGLAPQIGNLAAWRAHLLDRISRQHRHSADPRLKSILDEFNDAVPATGAPAAPPVGSVMPLLLTVDGASLSFFSTTMVVGGPRDVVISEVAVEMFLPADRQTREWLQAH